MMNTRNTRAILRTERGFALLETLIAFIVMAVGLLALLSFHSESQRNIADAKAQSEAVALAEEKLQELESFLASNDPRLTTGTLTDTYAGVNSTFTRVATVTDPTTTNTSIDQMRIAQVIVQWQDRNGSAQQVRLSSDMYSEKPTSWVENFMQVVSATSAVSGNLWGTGTSTSTATGTSTGTSTGTDTATQTGTDTQTDVDQGLTEIIVKIAGRLSGSVSVDLDQQVLVAVAQVDPSNDGGYYRHDCAVDDDQRGFKCSLIYTNNLPGWSGTVSLQTNKYFCYPVTASGTSQISTLPSSFLQLTYANLTGSYESMQINVSSNSNCN